MQIQVTSHAAHYVCQRLGRLYMHTPMHAAIYLHAFSIISTRDKAMQSLTDSMDVTTMVQVLP